MNFYRVKIKIWDWDLRFNMYMDSCYINVIILLTSGIWSSSVLPHKRNFERFSQGSWARGYNSTILELCLTDRPLWGWAVYIALVGNIPTDIGVRAIFCQGGGKPFTKQSNRNEGRCNKIGRTGIWKWLHTVFQGQYLPSLSINYVATNKHLEKLPPQVY